MSKFKFIEIKKTKDTVFDGDHPNGIYEGAERAGLILNDSFHVGERLLLSAGFITSTITKITPTHFHTKNSIYEYTFNSDKDVAFVFTLNKLKDIN